MYSTAAGVMSNIYRNSKFLTRTGDHRDDYVLICKGITAEEKV